MLEVKVEEGPEYSTIIKAYHNNKLVLEENDMMEPEDAVFYRDLAWIPDALKKMYQLGLEDGRKKYSSKTV